MDIGTTLGGYTNGGPAMLLILLIGVTGLVIAFERLYVIVLRSKNNGRAFIERVIPLVRAGKVDEAIKLCAGSTAALPDMGLLILRSRSRDEADLNEIAEAAALHVLPRLTSRIQYLPTLAVVAVLIGLAGMFSGLHGVFAAQAGADDRVRLWTGVANAMTAPALSLAVAAVLTLFRAYLVSQSESITEQIHEFSARLINALIDRPDVRLGHR
jgi:biopolymer transport protein ExbB/TolQ